jgi:hypothetical protein
VKIALQHLTFAAGLGHYGAFAVAKARRGHGLLLSILAKSTL